MESATCVTEELERRKSRREAGEGADVQQVIGSQRARPPGAMQRLCESFVPHLAGDQERPPEEQPAARGIEVVRGGAEERLQSHLVIEGHRKEDEVRKGCVRREGGKRDAAM